MNEHSNQHQEHKNHKEHTGHHDHNHHEHHAMMISDFRKRFWVSIAITAPILVLSPMIQNLLGGYQLVFSYSAYVLFALSTFVYFYGGWPFLSGLVDELKKKQPGMMTLIAVAITVAFGYSSATTFGLEGKKILLGAGHLN